MSNPTWTPTPADEIPPPEQLLAMFPDNTMGEIGAGDMRALVQAVCSTDAALSELIADELPAYTIAQAGMVLTVDGTGALIWAAP